MYQDTNDKKLVELNNSVKHQKFEHIAQVEYMQQEYNELNTKVGNLEIRSRQDKNMWMEYQIMKKKLEATKKNFLEIHSMNSLV